MKKFIILYNSSASAAKQMASATPEQQKAGMDAWMKWAAKAGPALVDLGMPVGNPVKIKAGAAGKSDNKTGGFSIMQAKSAKAVHALMKKHPHFMSPGATIDVLEFLPMPGMS